MIFQDITTIDIEEFRSIFFLSSVIISIVSKQQEQIRGICTYKILVCTQRSGLESVFISATISKCCEADFPRRSCWRSSSEIMLSAPDCKVCVDDPKL